MQSIYFKEKGNAEMVLEHGKKSIPPLPPDEIRVKVLASPINPADFMFIEKQYRVEPIYPQIAGFEGSGLIIDNGGDEEFPVNSKVAFRHKNIWAEFANIPKDKLILLPPDFPDEKAAQLSLNPLTAWALLEELHTRENEWIILSAGNSTLSKLIIQFAGQQNIKTISIVRDLGQKEELIRLGATSVLSSDDEKLEIHIGELTKNEKISGFLDAVGGTLTSQILKVISANSKIIHYGLYSDQKVSYHSSDIIFKNLSIQGFGIDGWLSKKTKAQLNDIWKNIIEKIMDPDFKMQVSGKYPFKDYRKAILEAKSSREGKTLFWME